MNRNASALSGLDIMQAMIRGEMPGAPIADLLNFTIGEVAQGRVSFTGTPKETMTNPMGTVHGGWYGTLLDSAMACAVLTTVPAGHVYTTLEYKVNIVRPIPLGTEIVATGETLHSGRSTGVATGEIRGSADGRLYATGSTTCIIMPAR